MYIKCCHTFQLPFCVDSIIPSYLCVCMFANVWAQLDLFLSVWVSRCRGGKITHKTSHNNNSPRIHTSLLCDLFKDLFLCWWSTFLLMLTLKTAFWFNVKIDYFGSVLSHTVHTTLKMSRLNHSNEPLGTRHGWTKKNHTAVSSGFLAKTHLYMTILF